MLENTESQGLETHQSVHIVTLAQEPCKCICIIYELTKFLRQGDDM